MNRNFSALFRSIVLALCLTPVAAWAEEPPGATPVTGVETGHPLTAEALYLLLLAEIAGARGEIQVSVEAYTQLARRTHDPLIARRATEIALFARNTPLAIEAARIWSEAEPQSEEARRVLAGVLASSGGERLDEIQIELARILANDSEQLEQNLLGLNRALARLQNKETVRAIVNRLTEPYLNEPAAHFARAQASAGAGDDRSALASIGKALELRPYWEPASIVKAQILIQLGSIGEANQVLAELVEKEPGNANVRLAYARSLVSAHNLSEARKQFQILLDASPGDRDMLFAVALVSFQLGDLETAANLFEQTLLAGHPEADGIRLNLGNIAERRGDDTTALRWYRAVGPGRHHVDAQLRVAFILARAGQTEEARLHLKAIAADENGRKRAVIAEAALLRDAERHGEAFEVLETALKDHPDDPDLLYEAAMIAERLDRVDLMEDRLLKLIALQPDHAHAYNALGYSLADRGLRLDEAQTLIEKALALQPNDPFILDSMGWVRFRLNDLDGALAHLERAYGIRSDPEIAAHLGEVLWALDRKDEARRMWDTALAEHPDNTALSDTVKRFPAQ
ncbi:MAG TPA: tetratricopeptide repeat protein [Rhodocyclaceae bacterium]|nr:tetratricopeptide repeat protein [Rhodocyclaceae bacterium]